MWSRHGTIIRVDHGEDSIPGVIYDIALLKEANSKVVHEKPSKPEKPCTQHEHRSRDDKIKSSSHRRSRSPSRGSRHRYDRDYEKKWEAKHHPSKEAPQYTNKSTKRTDLPRHPYQQTSPSFPTKSQHCQSREQVWPQQHQLNTSPMETSPTGHATHNGHSQNGLLPSEVSQPDWLLPQRHPKPRKSGFKAETPKKGQKT